MLPRHAFERKEFSDHLPPATVLKLIGEKTGIISSLYEAHVERDDPAIYNVTLSCTHIERLLGISEKFDPHAGGAGLTPSSAMMRAIGEVAERYAASFYNPDSIIYASYADLRRKGVDAIGPERLRLFSEIQYKLPDFPYKKFTEEIKLGWIEGVSILVGRPILFPAQLVFFGYVPAKDEPRIGYPTSSGCAAAWNTEEALNKAICEQVERDAVLISWYTKISPPHLDISSERELTELLSKRFQKPNIKFHLLYMTLDISIPVVMSISVDNSGRRIKAIVGGAANLNPTQAAFKALLEAAQGRPYLKFLSATIPYSSIDVNRMFDFQSNLVYYGNPENYKYLSFWLQSKKTVKIEEIKDESTNDEKQNLKTLLRKLSERNLTPIAFDLTTPDIEEVGLRVIRVIIPELVQLGVPSLPFLGSRRLYEVPKIVGYSEKVLGPEDLYKMPHPYP